MSTADRRRVRETLQRYTKAAAWEARCIRAGNPPDFGFIRAHLRGYILAKYMLPEGECRSDRIRDLTEASLARMMRVTPELAEQLDTARSCAGATSATVKKALLLQAMERELDVTLPADKAVKAENVGSLAELLMTCMEERNREVLLE